MRGKTCIIFLLQLILLLSSLPTIQSDFATAYDTATAENTNEAFVLNSTYPTIKILDSSGAPRPVSSIESLKYNTEKKLIFHINDEPQYDEAGYPVQEKTAKILISKDQLIDYFGDISDIALNYAFKVHNETTWEIDVPDITNTEIIIKKFTEPELGTKWFTRGSNSSIRLSTRPMYIEIANIDDRGFNLSISHPVCNDGQTVYINETWLRSKNITNPYFEWGKSRPWMPLEYNYTNGTYILQPKHFSIIGVHEARTGTTYGGLYSKNGGTPGSLPLVNALYLLKEELDEVDVKDNSMNYINLGRITDNLFLIAYFANDDYTYIRAVKYEESSMTFEVGPEYSLFYVPDISLAHGGYANKAVPAYVLSPISSNDKVIVLWTCTGSENMYGCKIYETIAQVNSDNLELTIIEDCKQVLYAASGAWHGHYSITYDADITKDYVGFVYVWSDYDANWEWYDDHSGLKQLCLDGNIYGKNLGSSYQDLSASKKIIGINPFSNNLVKISYRYGTGDWWKYYGVFEFTSSGIDGPLSPDTGDGVPFANYNHRELAYPDYIYYTTSSSTTIYRYQSSTHTFSTYLTSSTTIDWHAIPVYWYGTYPWKLVKFSSNPVIYSKEGSSIVETIQGASYDYDSMKFTRLDKKFFVWLIKLDNTFYLLPIELGYAGTVIVERTVGSLSETNIAHVYGNFTCSQTILFVPVSDKVNAITEVKYGSTYFTKVDSYNELDSYGKYYFDSSNKRVCLYIGSVNNSTIKTFTVEGTYGGSFELTLPSYLKCGDYFMARGLIRNADGDPISGLIATTTIYYQDGTPAVSTGWNCTGGNYQATIATTSFVPGIYNVEVSFYDINTGITFKTGNTLYLGVPISGSSGEDIYASAYLYYTVFDQNTGAKLEDDFYKFYISSDPSIDEYDRVMGGKYPVVLGQTYYIQIRDYWNNKIYPTNADYDEVFIDRAEFYYDVGIPFNQFLVKNSNDSIIYFRMTNGPLDEPGNTWYARWIPPYESAELFVRSGTYNISIQYYDPETQQLLKTVNITNFVIDQDVFYWIPGYKIGDIIIAVWNTNSSILNQIINIGVYVKNVNSSVINQIVNSTYLIENINTSIRYQTSVIQMMLNNTESNITTQINVMQQEIDNHLTNITNQANHIWQSVNNTNTSIISQLNAVWQEVNNTNTTLANQVNMIMQQIINYLDLWSSRATLPGTVRYWAFDNKSFKDSKGSDPITTNNISFSNEGKYGGAAQFSGEESYICAANGFNLSNGTVELWIKTNFGNEKDRGIVNKSKVFSIEYNATDQKLIGTVGHPSVRVEVPFIPDNQWHHVALTWRRLWNDTTSNWDTRIRMYVDGTLVDQSETNSELTFNSTEPLYIGCTDTSHSWKGLLDELFIYNRALTSDEIYYRYAGFSPVTQWNVILQNIDNTNASIRTQLNHLSQNISNTNASIHNQLNGIEQLINNTNSTIHSQLNIIVQEVNNANASIHAQLNTINQEIKNLNSTVEYQYNALSQKIVNFETNITGQVNSVWFAVNNTNTSIHQQLNLIFADIYNMNASIHTQINALSTQIQNMESNITDQTNLIAIKIDNMESNITNQINGVNITITNHNTSVMNQLNAILSQIINSNTSIIDQVNLIWNAVNNTNSTIHMQMNAIQNDINNANSTIHTQLNVISTQIINTESNITEQLNTINIKISNIESNITNQINGVNITITNHNTSVMNQINAIMNAIVNTNATIIDQINLIWNAVNNTNSSIQTQINGVHTTITTFWSDVNYSFTVIQSDISYHNTTIVNLINDMNASLYAQLVNVLDNVSESGESVFDKTMEILEKMGNLTGNLTLNDRLINILDNISDARIQILNKTIDILDKMGNLSSNTTLNDRLLSILDNISDTRIQILNKTLDILSKLGNLSSNNTLNDRLLDILDNISDTRIQILNKTLDILALLGDKINNQTISDALWDVLENITTMQQQMTQNFSYIEQVNVNLTNETLEMLDQIYNALLDVNATAMKDLYTLLEDVLRQFKLPHEWRLPQVNYTLEDKTPPVTTISAEITINSEIRVTWSSVDNVPLNVAHVDLYYKVENASYWKEWKLHQPATGTLIFKEEEPIEGKTYQFMALGTDSSGNKENQTDANTCSITYKQFVLSVSGLPTNPVQAALQNIQLILLAVALIILALVALLIYLRREQQNA